MSFVKTVRHFLHIIKCKLLYENRITPALYKAGCRLGLFKPEVVIYVDGGICSQMHQYLLGRYYAEQGFRVSYDIGWYARNGKDNNGIHSRIFEFRELWPELPMEIASSSRVAFYSRARTEKSLQKQSTNKINKLHLVRRSTRTEVPPQAAATRTRAMGTPTNG